MKGTENTKMPVREEVAHHLLELKSKISKKTEGKKGRDVDCNQNMHYTLCVNVANIQDVMLVAVYVVL